ncbi:MAG TPA: Gfo/Idh/MocA family oxidoreductase [bacterium]|nr:Gfo/Idh/MocA family oxidoreductase [bacterium]
MAKSGKTRIGIIGCGRIAREGHLPYLKINPDVELVGAADVTEKNRNAVCSQFKVSKAFCSAVELLDEAKPDGILICTPNWAHKELTLMAAERGIHVFCEKPMAVNSAEAEEMVAACESARVNLQIGMVKRFDAGMVKAKNMIESGRLGFVSSITGTMLNPPARFDSPVFETVKKIAEMAGVDIEEKLGLWRQKDKRTGGGQLLEMGTHLLDLIMYFAGERPVSTAGFISMKRSDLLWEDQGTITARFESGAIGTADMNMSVTADNLVGESGWIYGDKASLRYNLINGMWFGLPFYEYIPTQLKLYGGLSPLIGVGVPVPVKVGRSVYMHKLQMDYFVDGIMGRDRDYFGFGEGFASDGRDGLAVMKAIDDIYEKAEENGWR